TFFMKLFLVLYKPDKSGSIWVVCDQRSFAAQYKPGNGKICAWQHQVYKCCQYRYCAGAEKQEYKAAATQDKEWKKRTCKIGFGWKDRPAGTHRNAIMNKKRHITFLQPSCQFPSKTMEGFV